MGLVAFHIFLTTFTVMTRNHHTTQAVLFVLLLLTVRSSETINQYAAKNWQSFSRQQYFDSQGLFISVVFSMPVLFNCMMMVVSINSYCPSVITAALLLEVLIVIIVVMNVSDVLIFVLFFIIPQNNLKLKFLFCQYHTARATIGRTSCTKRVNCGA